MLPNRLLPHLLFALLLASGFACPPRQLEPLPTFNAHPEFTDLFLIGKDEVQWSLSIRRDSAERGFWQLDGQRLHYRDSLGLEIAPLEGRWFLSDGRIVLARSEARLQVDLELVAPCHWQGRSVENGRQMPLDLRLLGSIQPDSLRFFQQALTAIAPKMGLELPSSSDSSAVIYQAPHYYQYKKKDEDAEFYWVPRQARPTIWVLLRRADEQRFFHWHYADDGQWQCDHAPNAYRFVLPAQACLLYNGWLVLEPPQKWTFRRYHD